MAAQDPSNVERLNLDAESLGLLPDPTRERKLTWSELGNQVPRYKGEGVFVTRREVDALLVLKDKKAFGDMSEALWPFRTKADKPLRRTRLWDWYISAKRRGNLDVMREVLLYTRVGWDLIFVTNLVCATAVFGRTWFTRWQKLGAFDGDLTHYIAVTKRVSDLIKTRGLVDDNWSWYVECATMSGYRNPPFPGFDVVEEAKALADGGEDHQYFGLSWDSLCREFLTMQYHYVPFIAFENFVSKASWLTTGSSSVGHVMLQFSDGTEKKVKARKNMVADVVDLGELASDAVDAKGQENYVIIKSELGKLRLAVAGDIYTYLKMTWITYLLGGAYYDWPGNTSEENFVQQTNRMWKMLTLAAKKFGLPYDYAGFDHQPTTQELVGIARVLVDQARLNVPGWAHREFDLIADNVVNSFYQSTLEVRSEPGRPKFPVTGGLMSGLRWTSVVGNAWNSVITGLALKLLVMWGIDVQSVDRYIRGDDSAIFVDNWATGAAMNVAYDAIGAQAGQGKFSLRYHAMEFLRIWYEDRCLGYPARAIPGLTQRKPWSNEPWSEDMILKALHEACRTLKRRVESRALYIRHIWEDLRHIWCRNHSLPDAVTWAPTWAGGYGIEPPPVMKATSIKPPVPKATLSGVRITNQTAWRANNIRRKGVELYNFDVGEEANVIAEKELLTTVSADNVPDLATIIRQEWLKSVRTARCRAVDVEIEPFVPDDDFSFANTSPSNVAEVLQILKSTAPLFGSERLVDTARQDYEVYSNGLSFRKWLARFFPSIDVALRKFHRSWHMSEKLDYLAGNIPIGLSTIHPALVGIVASCVGVTLKPSRKAKRLSTAWIAGCIETEILRTPLSVKVYSY